MKNFPFILLIIYLIVFVITAWNPYDRAVWRAELLPVMVIVAMLILTYKKFQFSTTAYLLMGCWIFWHTIGGYYTFERVPFERFGDLFGFERNMFDRVGHYMIGFYAYPIIEFIARKKYINNTIVLYLFGIFAIFTVASVYEIIERWYAVVAGGEQGIAFLGSQGDVWDAQKDMGLDGLGAITVTILYALQYQKLH